MWEREEKKINQHNFKQQCCAWTIMWEESWYFTNSDISYGDESGTRTLTLAQLSVLLWVDLDISSGDYTENLNIEIDYSGNYQSYHERETGKKK